MTSTSAAAPTILITCALLLLSAASARTHEVAVEQIVDVDMRPQGDRLAVRLHIPATALVDAKLPRLADGRLDGARIDSVLAVVSADVVRNLDVQQAGTTLGAPEASTRVGADRRSIDIDLTYRIDDVDGLSARLNAFRSEPLQPVRTIVRYSTASGAT